MLARSLLQIFCFACSSRSCKPLVRCWAKWHKFCFVQIDHSMRKWTYKNSLLRYCNCSCRCSGTTWSKCAAVYPAYLALHKHHFPHILHWLLFIANGRPTLSSKHSHKITRHMACMHTSDQKQQRWDLTTLWTRFLCCILNKSCHRFKSGYVVIMTFMEWNRHELQRKEQTAYIWANNPSGSFTLGVPDP